MHVCPTVSHASMEDPFDLLQSHLDMVNATCLRVLRNAQDAADATQEVAMKWLQERATIRTSTAAWLHRVAYRTAVDMVRRHVSQRRVLDRIGREAGPGSGDFDEDGGPQNNLDAALEDLPTELRGLLFEHHLEGHDLGEMAKRRGTSRATVSRRLTDARNLLSAALGRRGVAIGGAKMG